MTDHSESQQNSAAASPSTTVWMDVGNGVKLPPFRSLDDFLSTNRFEAPPFNDLPKWNNRIIANLLYYQTNYFACFLGLLLLLSMFQAQAMVLGLSACLAVVTVAVFSVSSDPRIYRARKDHPLVTLGAIVLTSYYCIAMFAFIVTVTFCVLFPILLILIHASVRLRDFMNKVAQTTERVGLRTTAMGRLLDICGLSVKA